ncbi:Holliday junction-specific endonuclease [Mycoplasmopsis columbina SF7]|uniref:Holliday junction resolvase RecU n=2 Tax=Mycoplasmopsis columbina TaxID=114881 RepID=F9UJF5_9BACT|nr:Holliday junction-specific endonuclease [Mycoplasmopsis columbina SF7]
MEKYAFFIKKYFFHKIHLFFNRKNMNKNRGMLLENIINKTIDYYSVNDLAYIKKQIVPIKFSGIENGKIKNGFLYSKSTVDYIGCFKGKFIAFEAKTTEDKIIDKSNLKTHQIDYLKKIDKQGGIVFFILFYSLFNEFYLLFFKDFEKLNASSLHYKNIKKVGIKLTLLFPGIIDFLPFLN